MIKSVKFTFIFLIQTILVFSSSNSIVSTKIIATIDNPNITYSSNLIKTNTAIEKDYYTLREIETILLKLHPNNNNTATITNATLDLISRNINRDNRDINSLTPSSKSQKANMIPYSKTDIAQFQTQIDDLFGKSVGDNMERLFSEVFNFLSENTSKEVFDEYIFQNPRCSNYSSGLGVRFLTSTLTDKDYKQFYDTITWSGKGFNDIGVEDQCKSKKNFYLFVQINFKSSHYDDHYQMKTFLNLHKAFIGFCLPQGCESFFINYFNSTKNKKFYKVIQDNYENIIDFTSYNTDNIWKNNTNYELDYRSIERDLKLPFLIIFYFTCAYLIFKVIFSIMGFYVYTREDEVNSSIAKSGKLFESPILKREERDKEEDISKIERISYILEEKNDKTDKNTIIKEQTKLTIGTLGTTVVKNKTNETEELKTERESDIKKSLIPTKKVSKSSIDNEKAQKRMHSKDRESREYFKDKEINEIKENKEIRESIIDQQKINNNINNITNNSPDSPKRANSKDMSPKSKVIDYNNSETSLIHNSNSDSSDKYDRGILYTMYRVISIQKFIKKISETKNYYFNDTNLEMICGIKTILLLSFTFCQINISISLTPHRDIGSYYYANYIFSFVKGSIYALECFMCLNGFICGYKLMHIIKRDKLLTFSSIIKLILVYLSKLIVFWFIFIVFYYYIAELGLLLNCNKYLDFFKRMYIYKKDCINNFGDIFIPFYYEFGFDYHNNEAKYKSCFKFFHYSVTDFKCFIVTLAVFFFVTRFKSAIFDKIFSLFIFLSVFITYLFYPSIKNIPSIYTFPYVTGEIRTMKFVYVAYFIYFTGLNSGIIFFYFKDMVSSNPLVKRKYAPFSHNITIMNFFYKINIWVKYALLSFIMIVVALLSMSYNIFRDVFGEKESLTINMNEFIYTFFIFEKKIFILVFSLFLLILFINSGMNFIKNFLKNEIFVMISRISFCFICLIESINYLFYGVYDVQIYLNLQNLFSITLGLLLLTLLLSGVMMTLFEMPLRMLIKRNFKINKLKK